MKKSRKFPEIPKKSILKFRNPKILKILNLPFLKFKNPDNLNPKLSRIPNWGIPKIL